MPLKTGKPRVGSVDTRRVKPAPKVADAELQSAAYRRWREMVIARASGRCEAPGCGRSEPRMFADHIVERRDGGPLLDPRNGQCLCGSCHTRKTARVRAERNRA